MKPLLFTLFLLTSFIGYSQEDKDTTFSIREHTCTCKYSATEEGIPFDRFAKEAYYPGGEDAWKKFVKKNIDKGFKGKDEVQVRVQIDRDGNITDITLTNRAPNQKFEEVKRVLKLSGKWFPSVQKGFCVKSYVRLTFDL